MKNAWIGFGLLFIVLLFFLQTLKDIRHGKIVTSKNRVEFTGKVILYADNPAIFRRIIIIRLVFQLVMLVFGCFLIYVSLKN